MRQKAAGLQIYSEWIPLTFFYKCGALRDLVPFVQFKKCENTHGGVFLFSGDRQKVHWEQMG